MDLAVESALRIAIMDWVRERAEANGGFLHREELLGYRAGDRPLPLIDFSRGIRNPADFSSTLSIVSAANGPYDDTEAASTRWSRLLTNPPMRILRLLRLLRLERRCLRLRSESLFCPTRTT